MASEPGEYAEVPFRSRDFFVSFAGLTFRKGKDLRFEYRLVGLDDRWISTAFRETRYSSLPPGSYRFEVMARTASGLSSRVPATIAFRVIPPWWRTWWFQSLGAAAGLALIVLIARQRAGKLRRQKRQLEAAVRQRTLELEQQNSLVERQKCEIEKLLERTQETSRLKSEFLANMSHEIRTPMNGVIGMAQLALATELADEQRGYITTVRECGEALLGVINDILDFSKIEAGRLELVVQPFRLRDLVHEVAGFFSWQARAKSIELTHTVADDVPETVAGDSGRLRQILLNLVGNAMKFTDRGGITVAVIRESAAEGECTLRFSVADSGIGIPAEKQSVIFEAFAQVDGSMQRRQGGTGLGLAVSSKLVKLMHGQIWVASVPEVGSTFFVRVTFPVVSVVVEPAARPDLPARSSRALRALLVEDNPVNQRLMAKLLERAGHHVVVAGDGSQAVAAVQEGTFDLIFMDLQMPGMDGFEATRKIREEAGARRRIPIVALTAHAMNGHREQCLRAGMDGFLSKPINFGELLRVIEEVCASDAIAPG